MIKNKVKDLPQLKAVGSSKGSTNELFSTRKKIDPL
jgi:hypothetical protein